MCTKHHSQAQGQSSLHTKISEFLGVQISPFIFFNIALTTVYIHFKGFHRRIMILSVQRIKLKMKVRHSWATEMISVFSKLIIVSRPYLSFQEAGSQEAENCWILFRLNHWWFEIPDPQWQLCFPVTLCWWMHPSGDSCYWALRHFRMTHYCFSGDRTATLPNLGWLGPALFGHYTSPRCESSVFRWLTLSLSLTT